MKNLFNKIIKALTFDVVLVILFYISCVVSIWKAYDDRYLLIWTAVSFTAGTAILIDYLKNKRKD